MPYLFNRSVRLGAGTLLDSMAWAAKITEKVNAAGGPDVSLWTRVFSPGNGTLGWTAVVNDLSEMTEFEEQLMADGGYVELVDAGSQFIDGGADDVLVHLVHLDPDGVGTAVYASVTTTQLAPGMTAAGMALGVEIAQRVKAVTGAPTSFGASLTGQFGQVGWFVLTDTIDQLQAGNEALGADADWVALMDDRASKAYVGAVSERVITRRIA